MAINKVAQFGSTLTGQSDYQAQNAHINAFIQQMMGDQLHLTNWLTTGAPAIAQGVYIAHGGTLYLVETADASIATGDLSGSGDYYIRMSVSGDTLVADWESSLSGYAWNHVYNGFYSGTTQLLPYVVAFNGSAYVKYKYDFQRVVSLPNQDLNTDSNVAFNGISIGGIQLYSFEFTTSDTRADVWDAISSVIGTSDGVYITLGNYGVSRAISLEFTSTNFIISFSNLSSGTISTYSSVKTNTAAMLQNYNIIIIDKLVS